MPKTYFRGLLFFLTLFIKPPTPNPLLIIGFSLLFSSVYCRKALFPIIERILFTFREDFICSKNHKVIDVCLLTQATRQLHNVCTVLCECKSLHVTHSGIIPTVMKSADMTWLQSGSCTGVGRVLI